MDTLSNCRVFLGDIFLLQAENKIYLLRVVETYKDYVFVKELQTKKYKDGVCLASPIHFAANPKIEKKILCKPEIRDDMTLLPIEIEGIKYYAYRIEGDCTRMYWTGDNLWYEENIAEA